MSNTANWPLAGLVKTRGHLIMLRHAIGWNLRVCLLWLTGVEWSVLFSIKEIISTLCPDLFSIKRNCIQIQASFSTKRDCIQIQASFSTKRDCIQVHATKGTAAFRYMHFVSQKMTNGISNKRVSYIQVHANHAINLTSSGPCALSLVRKEKRVILPFSCERGPSFHWSLASSLQQWKLNSESLPIARRGLTAKSDGYIEVLFPAFNRDR